MALTFRDVRPEEYEQLANIDLAERIDGQYVLHEGRLELTESDIDVVGWHPGEVTGYVTRLHALAAAGGIVVGSWDRSTLVGLASLDPAPVGDDPIVMKLDMLYVSSAYRHLGIGKHLTAMIAEQARSRGATSLYISATPTRNTVDAYGGMGARAPRIAQPSATRSRTRRHSPPSSHLTIRGRETAGSSGPNERRRVRRRCSITRAPHTNS